MAVRAIPQSSVASTVVETFSLRSKDGKGASVTVEIHSAGLESWAYLLTAEAGGNRLEVSRISPESSYATYTDAVVGAGARLIGFAEDIDGQEGADALLSFALSLSHSV